MAKKHEHHDRTTHHTSVKSAWHKDWRTWVVVALMLAAMGAYILSMDESEGPGATPNETQEPAAM